MKQHLREKVLFYFVYVGVLFSVIFRVLEALLSISWGGGNNNKIIIVHPRDLE
jgi:hypothetical protein